jgi:hypothetical protein
VCGEHAAEYRVTDYGRTHDEAHMTISYSCAKCLPRWHFTREQLAKILSFTIAIAPIKTYGYICDEPGCGRHATDVEQAYYPPVNVDELPADGGLQIRFRCDYHFLRFWGLWYTAQAGITVNSSGAERSFVPIEDFLMEGTRWPGK